MLDLIFKYKRFIKSFHVPRIDNSGEVICRWDNANHWPDISTYPHHKHIDNKVFESIETSVGDVLNKISKKLVSRA